MWPSQQILVENTNAKKCTVSTNPTGSSTWSHKHLLDADGLIELQPATKFRLSYLRILPYPNKVAASRVLTTKRKKYDHDTSFRSHPIHTTPSLQLNFNVGFKGTLVRK